MISRFYINLQLPRAIDCRVSGWREVGTTTVTIERIEIDGIFYDKDYTDKVLSYHTGIYRELERKLGLPRYSLSYVPTVSEFKNEHF